MRKHWRRLLWILSDIPILFIHYHTINWEQAALSYNAGFTGSDWDYITKDKNANKIGGGYKDADRLPVGPCPGREGRAYVTKTIKEWR